MPAFLAAPFVADPSLKKESDADSDNEIKEVPLIKTLGKHQRDENATTKEAPSKKPRSSLVQPIAHTKLPSAMSKMLTFREGTGKEHMRKISRIVVMF